MADTPLSRTELLEHYAAGPSRLADALKGLTNADLDKRLSPDAWSIREITHHIVDGDDIWNTCIKAALGNPDGEFTLQWYWDVPQMDWAQRWHYAVRSLEVSLALFRANREHIAELLKLSPDAWGKSVKIRWPGETEISRITVEDVVSMHVNHLAGHLEDIQAILNAPSV